MADFELDLYGDLGGEVELEPVLERVAPPTPPWRKPKPTSATGEDRGPPSTSGVQALLELLRAGAQDFLDDDEADEAFGIEKPQEAPEEVDDLSGPLRKRRRSEAEFAGAAPADNPVRQAEDEAFDFEFEADLQKVSESKVPRNSTGGMLSEDGLSSTQIVVPEAPKETALQPAYVAVEALPTTTSKYVYNGRMKRWEMRTLKASYVRPPQEKRPGGPPPKQKVKLCRFFAIYGNCKFADRCYYAHSEAELDLGDDVEAQQRIISECAYRAWEDSEAPGDCSYAQALAVRLAIRFEAQPQNLLPTMEKTGLPMQGGSRATVKMLLRLCHPDKCSHPEAKRAVQILGPVLASCTS